MSDPKFKIGDRVKVLRGAIAVPGNVVDVEEVSHNYRVEIGQERSCIVTAYESELIPYEKLKVYYKKLTPDAKAPFRAHEGDAGWDLTAVSEVYYSISSHRREIVCQEYGTGLAFAIPEGYWLDVRARSSVYKKGLILSNGSGVVDSGYRGEVKGVFYSMLKNVHYAIGDRILQAILMPAKTDEYEFVEVDELPPSEDGRGAGGYGSSGR